MHRNVGHQYRVGRKAENSQEGQDSDTRDFCANRQKTNNLTTNVNSGGRARDLNHDQHDLALDRLTSWEWGLAECVTRHKQRVDPLTLKSDLEAGWVPRLVERENWSWVVQPLIGSLDVTKWNRYSANNSGRIAWKLTNEEKRKKIEK